MHVINIYSFALHSLEMMSYWKKILLLFILYKLANNWCRLSISSGRSCLNRVQWTIYLIKYNAQFLNNQHKISAASKACFSFDSNKENMRPTIIMESFSFQNVLICFKSCRLHMSHKFTTSCNWLLKTSAYWVVLDQFFEWMILK